MIINGSDKYNELKARMDAERYIQTRILRDYYAHPSINSILCAAVTFLNGETYIYSVSHKDAEQFDLITSSNELNGDVAVYRNGHQQIDIRDFYTPYVNDTHMVFSKMKDINKIIPLTTWGKILKRYNDQILQKSNFNIDHTYTFLDNAVNCLVDIERAGLAVDVDTFKTMFEPKSHRFVVDNKVYSQYYPYTITGRPSNRFGSINFAALNKSDGSRASFVSRFNDGVLIQLDFESYHLRLIANYMNVELPEQPIHEYLAQQYFGKTNISEQEYEEGKQITFSILYGADVETDIPLLKSIKALSKDIYHSYLENNSLIAPISKRKIEVTSLDATENKLFNYFVQNYEFESTVTKLQTLLKFLNNKQSRLVLYTYDAVLLDCHPDETSDILQPAVEILSAGGYPLRMSKGTNYDNLARGSIVF